MWGLDKLGFHPTRVVVVIVTILCAILLLISTIMWIHIGWRYIRRKGRPRMAQLILGGLGAAMLLTSLLWFAFDNWNSLISKSNEIDLSKNEGILYPANETTPAIPAKCAEMIPKDALVIFYGDNISFTQKRFQNIIRLGGEVLLQIDREQSTGAIYISVLRVFDDRNDIIAKIDSDGFCVRNTSQKKRPDESTLVVYDHNDYEVLNIRLLNKNAIRLTGIFRRPRLPPIVISSNSVKWANLTFSGLCSGPSISPSGSVLNLAPPELS